MSAVLYPTVLLGLGRFGREVVDTITRGLEREEPLLSTLCCPAQEVGAGLGERLEPLLRAQCSIQHLHAIVQAVQQLGRGR